MLAELYDTAKSGNRELLPIEKTVVPAQKICKRRHKEEQQANKKNLLSINQHEKYPFTASTASSSSTTSSQDAQWLRNLGSGQFLPSSSASTYHGVDGADRTEGAVSSVIGSSSTGSIVEQEERGERLLAAINRMEKYLTRDIMLQELMSKDNVESAVETPSTENITIPTVSSYSAGVDVVRKTAINININNTQDYKSTNSKTWLKKEKERLLLLSLKNHSSTTAGSGSILNGSSTLPLLNKSTISTMKELERIDAQIKDNDVTTSLGLPLFPTKHKSQQPKPVFIGESEVDLTNLPKVNKKRKSSNNSTLPPSFTMPSGMVNAVSNIIPFRNQLQKHSLGRGDWVSESEKLMTEERKSSIQLASSNVQPPFWNPNDSTTVIQYAFCYRDFRTLFFSVY